MHNWYGIETEAEFRRQEWQRAIEAERRVAATSAGRAKRPGLSLLHLSLGRLRSLRALRLPVNSPLAPRRAAAYSSK